MDRLEAVADVGQGARHDHAHRVVEVAHPHLVLDADGADVAQVVGHRSGSPNERSFVSCQRGLGLGHAEDAVRRTARLRSAAVGRRRGARPAADPVEAGADRPAPSGRRASARASRMTQARWPSFVSAASLGLGLEERVSTASRSTRTRLRRPRRAPSGRPARRRRSAGRGGPARARRPRARGRRRSTNGIVAIVEPTRRRSQRDGE